jgi:hypothetical protein
MPKYFNDRTTHRSHMRQVLQQLDDTSTTNPISLDERKILECGICQDAGKDMPLTKCQHSFHDHCLQNWKDCCTSQYRPYTCPICRQSLVEEVKKRICWLDETYEPSRTIIDGTTIHRIPVPLFIGSNWKDWLVNAIVGITPLPLPGDRIELCSFGRAFHSFPVF